MASLSTSSRDVRLWVIVVGVVLIALNLRGPILAPAPVLEPIREDLGLSSTIAGLLTSLPVLCFALAGPLVTRVIRRFGPEGAVMLCLLGVLAGTIIRSVGPTTTVFLGTAVIGASIMIGNITVPVIIRRDVPWRRAGAVTGLYTTSLNVGGMMTSLGTVPLANLVGWRWALALWGVFAVLGMAYWGRLRSRRLAMAGNVEAKTASAASSASSSSEQPEPPVSPAVNRIGWLLLVAFAAQCFAYYAVSGWLPTLLQETRGLDPTAAGGAASLFQVMAVVGAFGVPLIASRASGWVAMAAVAVAWLALPIGLLVAPGAFLFWAFLGAIGHGGAFTAILSTIAQVTRSDREAATVSARVQTGGYLFAAAGAPLAGALNSATGGWTAPLLLILGALVTFTVSGVSGSLLARHQRPALS